MAPSEYVWTIEVSKLTTTDKYPMPELINRVGECKGRYFMCLNHLQVKVAD